MMKFEENDESLYRLYLVRRPFTSGILVSALNDMGATK